jgi:hypothetical protein
MLSEYEIGASLKIPLQSAISLEIKTFTSRTIFGKSGQYHIINANFLQVSLAIVQSLKGVAFRMNPLIILNDFVSESVFLISHS